MIMIYSVSNDFSTQLVIEHLNKLSPSTKIIRLNTDEDSIKFIRYDDDNFLISINGSQVNLFDVKSFWYRKGGRIIKNQIFNFNSSPINKDLKVKIFEEYSTLDYFIKYFLEKNCDLVLGNPFTSNPNKFKQLIIARESGLIIPKTYILTNKSDLKNTIDVKGELITKAMSDGIYLFYDDYSYYSYTEIINKDCLHLLPETFPPSLFQEKIDKDFEIRAFFFNNIFFSMAIFSQGNKNTNIDYRKYDSQTPNRRTTYKLPDEIEKKLKILAEKLDINTGSFDIIFDKRGRYIFLEVNPVGQFGMVSEPCNYCLEKKIATYLLSYNGKN